MSQLHFTATEVYAKRVIQLGEQPDRVFNVGALGIESINKLKLLSRSEFEQQINWSLGERNLLVTFHPVTLEIASAEYQFRTLLRVLDEVKDAKLIFTKANADTDGRIINQLIDEYVSANAGKAIAFTSLGQLRYLSALQFMDVVVGNSSSGILEVPSFKKPTVNIGDRQLGRMRAASIIDCEPNYDSVKQAVNRALMPEFISDINNVENPYGSGNASEKIISVLKGISLQAILKKRFYDL
jgi:GDP/UDP-N,N'-diacetylbacillosamine 2-epimerase (hydrolysing)